MADRLDGSDVKGPSVAGPNVEDLVRRAQAGSTAAFGELVARYESPLFNFLLRQTSSPEDAEEIAQDAFLRAWQRLDRYDSRWRFSTWLFTLARRLAATRQRTARHSTNADGVLDALPGRGAPDHDSDRTDDRQNAWSIADRVLGGDQRSALWLRYAEDLSVAEIAEVLGRSSVSVRVMLYRARARLAGCLSQNSAAKRAAAPRGEAAQLRKVGT